jgi:hypothetical protein
MNFLDFLLDKINFEHCKLLLGEYASPEMAMLIKELNAVLRY